MEGLVALIGRAPADRVGEPGDRPRIGARQVGDNRIDQRADPFRLRGEARERSANTSVRALGGGDGRVSVDLIPRRPEAYDRFDDLIIR